MKYKKTTFVKILLIYSHYKPGKSFLKGAPFFWQPPCICAANLSFSLWFNFARRACLITACSNIIVVLLIVTSKGPSVTRCKLSCNLQCNSTLGRCKIDKYKFPLQFANIFLTYQTFVTNLHLSRVELRCKLQEKLHRVTGPKAFPFIQQYHNDVLLPYLQTSCTSYH